MDLVHPLSDQLPPATGLSAPPVHRKNKYRSPEQTASSQQQKTPASPPRRAPSNSHSNNGSGGSRESKPRRISPKTGALFGVREGNVSASATSKWTTTTTRITARAPTTTTVKPLLPVTERMQAQEKSKKDAETEKWDITPDGGSAGREGRQFTVANVGNNGRIYLRQVDCAGLLACLFVCLSLPGCLPPCIRNNESPSRQLSPTRRASCGDGSQLVHFSDPSFRPGRQTDTLPTTRTSLTFIALDLPSVPRTNDTRSRSLSSPPRRQGRLGWRRLATRVESRRIRTASCTRANGPPRPERLPLLATNSISLATRIRSAPSSTAAQSPIVPSTKPRPRNRMLALSRSSSRNPAMRSARRLWKIWTRTLYLYLTSTSLLGASAPLASQ